MDSGESMALSYRRGCHMALLRPKCVAQDRDAGSRCCRPENASRVDEAVGGSGAPAQKSVEVCDSMARLAPSYSRVARRGLV
jgi:hypothetical protein